MRHLIGITILVVLGALASGGCILGPQPEPPDVTEDVEGPPNDGLCDLGDVDWSGDVHGGRLDCNEAGASGEPCPDDGDGYDPSDELPGEDGLFEPTTPHNELVDSPFDRDLDGDNAAPEPTADPDDYYGADEGFESEADGEEDDDDDDGDSLVI